MTIVNRYLEKLREAGVYDNSVIIVMADHGYGYDRVDSTLSRGCPLLAVKGIGETHDTMQFDDAPLSYVDLQEAYRRLLDGKPSGDCFDWKTGDERTRRILIYEYGWEDRMTEYECRGHASVYQNLVPTDRYFYAE